MSTHQMRDGSVVADPRLGRLKSFDQRSRAFNVADLLTAPLKGKTWSLKIYLDQLQTDACVGNGRTYDLAASPSPLRQANGLPFDEDFAQALYHLAQKYDEWPGEDYGGSSVLGGAKAAQHMGFIGEYRWAFNIDDMLRALATIGPVVVGTDWRADMFSPDPWGVISPTGSVEGGHSYIIRGIIVGEAYKASLVGGMAHVRKGIPLLRARNSWGTEWGVNHGEFLIWADDYERVLMPGGDQSITTTAFHR
jgi:hypothetical protein